MGLSNGKFLIASSVTDAAIRLRNNFYLIARDFADTANINILKVNASDDIEFATIPEVTGLGALALNSSITTLQSNRALTTLANLGTTAINSDFTFNKGSGVAVNIVGKATVSTESSGIFTINSGDATGAAGNSGSLVLKTGSSALGATGDAYLSSGNAASGNSGSVTIQTGTATGARGKIKLVDGSEGTVGQIWTSTNADGSGAWSAAPTASINCNKEQYTILAPIVIDTVVAMAFTPIANSVLAFITTGPILVEGTDYTIAVGNVTLLAASPVIALLTTSDIIEFDYVY
jgi:hypothetical protein